MTKLKTALLGGTFLMLTAPAFAQTAPTDVWTFGAITLGSTNTGAVSFTGDLGVTNTAAAAPAITAGTLNRISATSVGAAASNPVTQFHDGGSTDGSAVTYGAITLTATNSTGGTVSSATDIFGATVTTGTANTISAAAVGASGSQSITNVVDGAGTAPTTTVTFGGAISVTAVNSDTVGFTGNIGTTNVGADAPTIAAGQMNQITAAGVGSSAGLSVTNVHTGGSTSNQTFTSAGQTTGLTSTNNVDAAVTVTTDIFGATITSGVSNSISAAAVGSVASHSLINVVDGLATAPTSNFTFGNMTLSSTNSAAISLNGDLGSTANAAADNPSIAGGQLNTISMSGVGAAGSTSITGVHTNDSTSNQTFTYGTTGTTATNSGGVTVVSNIYGGTIGGGVGNGISSAAVGAAASHGFTLVVR